MKPTPELDINPSLPSFRRSAETEALIRHLPTLDEGTLASYEALREIAALPDTPKGNARLHAALAVARRKLEPKGILFGAVSGIGIKRLLPAEIVALGTATIRRSHRLAARGVCRMGTVPMDRLSEGDQAAVRVQISQLAVIVHATSRKVANSMTQATLKSGQSFTAADALRLMTKRAEIE